MDTDLSFFGRKGLPQGRALPLLASPHPAQAECPVRHGLDQRKEHRSGKGTGAPEKAGKGLVLSHSHSFTNRNHSPGSLLQSAATSALCSAGSHRGRGLSGGRKERRQAQGWGPQPEESLFCPGSQGWAQGGGCHREPGSRSREPEGSSNHLRQVEMQLTCPGGRALAPSQPSSGAHPHLPALGEPRTSGRQGLVRSERPLDEVCGLPQCQPPEARLISRSQESLALLTCPREVLMGSRRGRN